MKLINKDAVLTEIARQKAQWRICKSSEAKYRREMLDDISSFIDTLEVKEVDLEDTMDETKDEAMRDIAWKVHVMISKGKSVSEIDHYVCGICDF